MVDLPPLAISLTSEKAVPVDIPLGLRQALEAGDCVLFIGAGMGRHMLRGDGCCPNATELAADLATAFKIDIGGRPPALTKISQIVELRKGRLELETHLKKKICDFEPDVALQWICTRRWKAIYTTNYDNGVEAAYQRTAAPPQTPVPIAITPEIADFDRRFQVPIYYLHGRLCGGNPTPIIVTENDYAHFRKQRQMMFEILKKEFATSTFLYIGYSNQDPNWDTLLDELRAEFYPSELPQSYRVAPTTDPIDDEILRSKNIETIAATFDEFQRAAAVALAGSAVSTDALSRLQDSVPPELLPAFDKNAAAVARLLNSWDYINRVPMNSAPNIKDFYRGDKANWSLIAKGAAFERDLEEQVYDSLIDYATSSLKSPDTKLVLAPAGYGTTTLLRQLAVRLVKDRAGHVFMHKEGTPLVQGDIEFASSLFPGEVPFFIIDNPADHQEVIYTAVQRLRELSRPSLFLMGERLNEWRVARRGRAPGSEFSIEPLSDPEIARLLSVLEVNGELNALADLDPELRVAAIKNSYKNELLVTLREASEGKAFDAILEDEFWSIPDDAARKFYLIVCCFYQHGAMVRDTLLAEMVGQNLADMYTSTKDATAGVVLFEEIDPSFGHYAARARHRKIATVVWERCAQAGERNELILGALARMNLNYSTDVRAFENFIRSDRLVDSIIALEDRIRFFDQACQKDPTSPYVRQHYARMLARAGSLTFALSQIEEGLKLNSQLRVLHHTKGLILHQLAVATESRDIARRRMAQSEAEFRHCIADQPKDEYAHQGLATLYVDWAERADDPAEAAEYLAKAEDVISNGLKQVRVRDGLWLVSARIQKTVGNQPERMKALVKAATSAASVVPKYILGRAYREAGKPQEAIDVLKPVFEAHPDEFRISVEYALAMADLGEPYSRCISVLKLSTTFGYSDPRFVGTLGGMLFLNGSFSEADKVFEQTYKREFPAAEAMRVQFRPKNASDRSKQLHLKGRVATVRAGYAFIDVTGYPQFFCPGSKFGSLIVQQGMDVEFDAAFTAKGPTAERLSGSGPAAKNA